MNDLVLNPFSISGIVLSVTSILLTLILLIYGKSNLHKICALFNFVIFIWGIGSIYIGSIQNSETALHFWRWIKISITFIPILNYHVVYLLCRLNNRKILYLVYLQGIIFSILSVTTTAFISKVQYVFNSFYYDVPGSLYYIYFLIWAFIVLYTHIILFKVFLGSKGRLRSQILYFFTGTVVGFSGGISNFFPTFGINFYPFGNYTIPLYSAIITYAVIRYRLLDITVAITRTGIFVAVYSLILGIPFALAFGWQEKLISLFGKSWWIVPLVCSTVLATVGPFIYLYIQKKAEDQLLREQKRYQMTLRQASLGMSQIKDLQKLLNLIAHIVTRSVHVEYTSVYLWDSLKKEYFLQASRSKKKSTVNEKIDANSYLIFHLKDSRDPLVYEEVKQKVQDYDDKGLQQLEVQMRELDAAVIIPSFAENKLLALIVLGKKLSGKLYSEDDLAVFSILANQAALAIENAQFYEDVKKTQEQLFQAEKMATIGTMADGLSHQINNRLHALGFIASDVLDTIKVKSAVVTTPEMGGLISEIEHSLKRIQENVKQGGEIVQGLLKYSRKGDSGFTAVDFDQLLTSSIEMAQFKIKVDQVTFVRDYEKDIPKIHGNFVQLQEVFFNLIDNAYDAIMQRKTEKDEAGFKGVIRISAKKKDNSLEICVLDNGMGVKSEDNNKLFTPFFTTKLSSKKGTGLGLYVIQKIIEDNHKGKVKLASEYMTGTLMTITLPVAF